MLPAASAAGLAGRWEDSPVPLNLDLLREFGDIMPDSFTDLIYGGRPHGSIGIELEVVRSGRQPLTLAATVQNIDEYRTQVVSSLEVRSPRGVTRMAWQPGDPPGPVYSVDGAEPADVGFSGLLPVARRDFQRDFLDLVTGFPRPRYFGPFRDRPRREYRLPSGMPAEAGIVGEHAAGMLASDQVRGGGLLLRRVNQDLAEHLPGWTLDVVEQGRGYAVLLRSRKDLTLSVNLADAGTGVAQVLPVFVQRAADVLNPPSHPVLEIIEQPELHLHPAAHGALADLYLTAAKRDGGNVRFLIETHSETFLLRLRRRIAEGIDPGMVAVYFVEHSDGASTARKITIDENGNLDYWPEGVFSEDYRETQALAAAQLNTRDSGAR